MRPVSIPSRTRRDLKLSTGDGVLFAVMVGTGEAYFGAFALAIGLGEVLAGLVASVPFLSGAVLQLISPAMVRWLGSHKRWVVLCAAVQAVSFVPLIAGAAVGRLPAWALFLAVAVYWGAGMATGPAWNTWAGTLVPRQIRARFFANRTRVTQVGVLVGLIVAGVLLQRGSAGSMPARTFTTLFVLALAARVASTLCLAGQSEPIPLPDNHRTVSLRELSRRRSGDVVLLLYMLGMQAAVQISGPYFTPYMLKQLSFRYDQYMAILGMSLAAKFLLLPLIGRMAHRLGPAVVLWIGGLGIVPLSALWMVSDSFPYLLALQAIGGPMWGCYEIGTFLLLFETIPTEERTSVLTTFNFFNALFLVGGSLIGAAVLKSLGEQADSYHLLFGLSMAARIAVLPILLRIRVPQFRVRPIPLRTIAVRPSAGAVDRPVVAGIGSDSADLDPQPTAAEATGP